MAADSRGYNQMERMCLFECALCLQLYVSLQMIPVSQTTNSATNSKLYFNLFKVCIIQCVSICVDSCKRLLTFLIKIMVMKIFIS